MDDDRRITITIIVTLIIPHQDQDHKIISLLI